ncbi:hypothetical protein D3C81_1194040 [compost metagenome]
MSEIRRFYIIKNANTELIRGWRAHRIEQRWFYVLSGSFSVDLVEIDNWEMPSSNLPIKKEILHVDQMKVLHVPPGLGTAFRALEANSELLVYADYPIEHAPFDDHTWPIDYFSKLK